MKTIILCLVLLGLAFVNAKVDPLSDEFIDLINSKHSTWTAGRNFHENTSIEYIHGLMGVLPKTKKQFDLPYLVHPADNVDIPDTFDARENWPDCASVIGDIRDQGSCGSCWAVAAVGAMSDRICIHSKSSRKVSVSAQDLMACCESCGNGCLGGELESAWEFWSKRGIVTGGGYHSNDGCKSYSIPPCEHHTDGTRPPCDGYEDTPRCTKVCDDGSKIENALTFGKPSYYLKTSVEQIQLEILQNGPVEAGFNVYEDFLSYKSGVYQYTFGSYAGDHAVKILGWGVDEDETPYWLIANSWNSDWGDNGYFKFLRGEDHCGMESDIVAGLPRL